MENNQVQRTVISNHELVIHGKIFKERKEHFKMVDGTKESEEKSTMVHRREINDSYYEVRQSLINGNVDDESTFIETNLEDDEQIDNFKNEWEAEFKPSIGQPKGIAAKFKSFLKF